MVRRRFGGGLAFLLTTTLVGLAFTACDLELKPFVESEDSGFVQRPDEDSGGAVIVDTGVPDSTTPPVPDAKSDGKIDNGPKRVFVTSSTSNGILGGQLGADQKCNQLATAAQLGGTFKAWLSVTGSPAPLRLEDVGPWFLVDRRTLVFANKAAFVTGPQTPINRTEQGLDLPAQGNNEANVWTGTQTNGQVAGNNCNNFNVNVGIADGLAGTSTKKNENWTQEKVVACDQALRLYCFEQ